MNFHGVQRSPLVHEMRKHDITSELMASIYNQPERFSRVPAGSHATCQPLDSRTPSNHALFYFNLKHYTTMSASRAPSSGASTPESSHHSSGGRFDSDTTPSPSGNCSFVDPHMLSSKLALLEASESLSIAASTLSAAAQAMSKAAESLAVASGYLASGKDIDDRQEHFSQEELSPVSDATPEWQRSSYTLYNNNDPDERGEY
jgi:hypothetical protein